MDKVQGIDVSAWQDSNYTPQMINWGKAASKGAKFCFIRAAYISKKDEDFDYNWSNSKRVGILRGAYHYPSYQYDPVSQADFFWSIIKDDTGDLPPVLDLEQVPGTSLPNGNNWLIWTQRYLNELERLCGRKPIFYSNPNIIINVLGLGNKINHWLTQYPLWIAHYGVNVPISRPWPYWTFWQYSSTGDGLGYGMESKGLDMDWFNGTEEELRKFAGTGNIPETSPILTLEEKVNIMWEEFSKTHG